MGGSEGCIKKFVSAVSVVKLTFMFFYVPSSAWHPPSGNAAQDDLWCSNKRRI